MPDIIGAKCGGCGHILRVPARLGGKKAKCPECSGVIIIPRQATSDSEVVTDDMLPEVAKDGELVNELGEVIEPEGDEILDGEFVEEEPKPKAPSRRSRGTGVRGRGATQSGTRMQAARPGGRRGAAPVRRKSKAPLIVGVAVGVLIVIVIIAVAAGGSGTTEHSNNGENGQPEGPDPSEVAKAAILNRFEGYLSSCNDGNIKNMLAHMAVSSDSEKKAIQGKIDQASWQHTCSFKLVSVDSTTVNGSSATLQVKLDIVKENRDSKEKDVQKGVVRTFQWVKQGETWMLTPPDRFD